MMREILTIILAGGRGERLYPLTKERTKPAVPFGGVYRIIDFTLSNCINSGIRKIYLLTQYKSFALARHIREGWNILHREMGEFIELLPAQQRIHDLWYQGTADAIYQNIYFIEKERPYEVLILAGDHIYKMNYEELLSFHRKKRADLTLATLKVPKEEAYGLGVIQIDKERRVIGFEEKSLFPKTIPGHPSLCLVSMGIYLFNTEVLVKRVIEDTKKETDHDFGKNIIPEMVKKNRVFAFPFQSQNKKGKVYWRDIGTIDAYWKANMDLVNTNPKLDFYDKNWPIYTYQGQYPPAKIIFSKNGEKQLIQDSLISPGCFICGEIKHSVLSPGVRIEPYSQVVDSILLERVKIGGYAKVKKAIIDRDVQIPAKTKIGYDLKEERKKFMVTESGIIIVPEGIKWE